MLTKRQYTGLALVTLCGPFLAALLILAGCSRPGGNHPIVGTWVDDKYGESMMVFGADGSVSYDVDIEKMGARVLAKRPDWADRVKNDLPRQRESMRALKATWTKVGGLYQVAVDMTLPDGKQAPAAHWKIEDGKLMPCKEDGTGYGGLAFLRKTD